MNIRFYTLLLLASAALPAHALAQQQPDLSAAAKPAAAEKAKPKPKPQAVAQAATASAPTAIKVDPRAQQGLTASPSDFGRVDIREGADGATPGGVTGKDLGGGFMIEEEAVKTRSTVTRDAIDKLSSTANPYQMIQMLPGANVSSVDAFGMVGGNITVRGFNSDQIGLTIEGAPVNDSGNYALYPQEYVDSENVGQVSLSQGTPDLDSPHIGSTGGVMNMYMREPSKTMGGLASVSMGTNLTRKQFFRVETGQVGDFRGYMSFSHYEGNHWNDPGSNNRNHVDFKGVWEPGQGNRVALSVIYNAAINNSYKTPTLSEYQGGTRWLTALPSTFFSGNDQSAGSASNYYGFRVNPFKNAIVSIPSNFTLTKQVTFDTVPYYWYGYGNGGGVSTMTERPAGSSSASTYFGNANVTGVDWSGDGVITDGKKVLLYNPSVTQTHRPGVINKFTYDLGDHKIIAGHWFELAQHNQTAPYAALRADGSISDAYLSGDAFVIPTGAYTNQTLQRRDQKTRTMTNQVFVGDTWTVNNRLSIEYGIKQAFINRHVTNGLPGATPTYDYDDRATLPQIGARYRLDEHNQVFANIGTAFRSTPNYTLADSFSTSTGVKTPISPAATEKSLTAEMGHRYQGEMFATSVSLFGTKYRNRQITSNVCDPSSAPVLGCTTYALTINAGDATIYGIDAEIGTRRFFGGWRAYTSGELLRTRLSDNLPVGVNFLPTSGKELPRAPRYQAAFGIDYDDGHMFGNMAWKVTGQQYSTLMNDQSIPSFARLDAAIGYRFGNIAGMKEPEFKINFMNLTNRKDLNGVSGVQSNALATVGTNGTSISASGTPTYYQSQGFAFLATFKVGF
jgi:iron complex outermembrane receptor protein